VDEEQREPPSILANYVCVVLANRPIFVVHWIGRSGVRVMDESEQEAEPSPQGMTREQFDLLTFQGIDPITRERTSSSAEIKKEEERQSNHEFRVFLIFGVPVGLVVALFVALATNMGNGGFFSVWAVTTMISGAIFSSLIGRKPSK
jgi:hypothetical protein